MARKFSIRRRSLLVFLIVAGFLFLGVPRACPGDGAREIMGRVSKKLGKELSQKGLALGAPIYIRIFKESKELEVWVQKGERFELFKTYGVFHYSGTLGPKLKEGDCQAPEGFYFVTPGRMNPQSRFHLSFNIGYPNAYDRHWGRTGSLIMVHGGWASIGCFAMTDSRIEEIYTLAHAALENGQPFFRVHVFPFRMTGGSIEDHIQKKWYRRDRGYGKWRDFWVNLKQGHDFFENHRIPPDVTVEKGRYVFALPQPAGEAS